MNREQRRRKVQKPTEPTNEELEQVPLNMRIGGDFKANLILVQLNRKVDNLTFTAHGARSFVAAVTDWADKIEAAAGATAAAGGSRLILPPGVRDH